MGRPPSAEARAKMLNAATEILLEVGVYAFTFDEVVHRSGVAKTTIYRHFPTKNSLIVAALDGATAVPITPDTGNLRDDLWEFLTSVMPVFANEAVRVLYLDIAAAGNRDPELKALQASMMAGRAGPTMTIYNRARRRGEINPDIDYVTALEIIEGPFIVQSFIRPESFRDVDLEPIIDRIMKQLA